MFCGGGFSSSISSVAKLRNTERLLPLISSSPSKSMDIRAMANVLRCRIRSASSTLICTTPSTEPPPTNKLAERSSPRCTRGCLWEGYSSSSAESGSRMNVRDGGRRWVSCATGAARLRRGDCDCPRLGIVLPAPRGGGRGMMGALFSDERGARGWIKDEIGIGRRLCEALRALVLDDERGGMLPGGML